MQTRHQCKIYFLKKTPKKPKQDIKPEIQDFGVLPLAFLGSFLGSLIGAEKEPKISLKRTAFLFFRIFFEKIGNPRGEPLEEPKTEPKKSTKSFKNDPFSQTYSSLHSKMTLLTPF